MTVRTNLDDALYVHEGRFLRAGDARILRTADDLIAAAQAKADQLVAAAQAEADRIREAAREEGWRKGRDEAAKQNIEVVIGALKFLRSTQGQFSNLVVDAVRTIISELPPAERMTSLAENAMKSFLQQTEITFRVNPADLEAASEKLVGLAERLAPDATIRITASDEVPRTGVFVETPLGVVDASLETQLENLHQALLDRQA